MTSIINRIFILLILIIGFQNADGQTEENLIDKQKKIVAELSGHKKLKNGKIISSRSKKEERQLARKYLSELLLSHGFKSKYQEYTSPNVNPLVDLLFDPFKGANVYTILPSSRPSDEYIVIGAHFDTERYCPGAIDNASGIAIAFGVFKMVSELKIRNANLILVFFDQEEELLVGSRAFAQKLRKERFKILSVHTLDTMGWDSDGDKSVELELPTEFLKEIYIRIGTELNLPIYATEVNSSDHQSFRELGFNVTGLTDELSNGDYAPYKDTPKDTYDTVNFNYVESCTELVYRVIKQLIQ